MQVGLLDTIVAGKPRVDTFTRANYLGAVAARADSFWVPDHLNGLFPRSLWKPEYTGLARVSPSIDAFLEPWTMLGHLAARNRIGRLGLGVCVTDTGRRNPAVTAQAAVTMSQLTRGRFILGIGTGEREGNEPYGVDWSKPVGRFEEAMATIRALWDSGGELVNRDSPYFPLRNALFDLPAYRGKWPPIWIAAHGPRMLRIAGRYADGYFPAFPHTPEAYAQRLDAVRSAASDAGRDPMAITPALCVSVVTGRTNGEVEAAMDSEVMRAACLTASDEMFAKHGLQHPLGVGFSGAQDLVPQGWDEQTALSYAKGVTPELMRDLGLVGTPDEVLDKAAQWRDAGVRHMVLINGCALQRSAVRGFTSLLPFAQIVRRLKRL
ncbi:LLM class flavin-dependent oxidoreductase [Mycolicibacterium fluoranthenivorans]|uniref:LLM class flavin-dependent oxidoreductase n=1 Tax=Mycolicibacterium fluoranthenivorans TaxID=258505 RepID=A0A7G8PJC8_9MYCO|nr:LLM class flavin-dependent oxidoreductase [Mycolicibacterium fluoranthenivorans]QNJ94444.1 LLM class flavin-dependent oxidoreductase [Mycolicibacterium fluoranthenivorans]